jgi:DnaJ-class molecular chaperone
MKVYNRSTLLVEKATMQQCPRCRGFGGCAHDADAHDCYLCEGKGRLWISVSGWTRALWKRLEDSKLY